MGEPIPPVFDARDEHVGQPGLHALIIGISDYVNLPGDEPPTPRQEHLGMGLRKLSCAARSARLVHDWLVEPRSDLALPLVTCRLLVSPVARELAALPEPQLGVHSATLEAVLGAARDWRADAETQADNITLFYFAGHGFQTTRGNHILILADAGDGLGSVLFRAIDGVRLMDGMAPCEARPDIARHQFYFFDACRMRSADAAAVEGENSTAVWEAPALDRRDERVKAVYHTTEPGSAAFSIPNEQTYFSKALLRCVEADGAEELPSRRWGVTAASLARGLEYHMSVLEAQYRRRQRIEVSNASSRAVLRNFSEPPRIGFDVEVVPNALAPQIEMRIGDLDSTSSTYGPPLQPHPFPVNHPAGPCVVTTRRVGGASGPNEIQKLETVRVPPTNWSLSV